MAAWASIQDQVLVSAERTRSRSATDLARSARHEPGSGWAEAESAGRTSGPGAALGTAVHAVLELVDFDRPEEIAGLARRCAIDNGVPDRAEDVERRARAAIDAPTLQLARRVPHHRELYVAGSLGAGVVEGFIDLCLETDDGYLIVDYKTDRLDPPIEASIAAKLADYRLQGATYAHLLARITGRPVVGCRFVFIGPDEVREADLPDLDRAVAEVAAQAMTPSGSEAGRRPG